MPIEPMIELMIGMLPSPSAPPILRAADTSESSSHAHALVDVQMGLEP